MKAGIRTLLQNRTENIEKKLTVCTDVDNQELLQNYFGVLSASLSYGMAIAATLCHQNDIHYQKYFFRF